MSHGGGLDREFHNPLYKEKVANIPLETVRGWVENFVSQGKSQRLTGRVKKNWTANGLPPTWRKSTAPWVPCGGWQQGRNLLELHTKGLTYKVATAFDGTKPTTWEERSLGDPQEALRVKIIEMLGSEARRPQRRWWNVFPSHNRSSTKSTPVGRAQCHLRWLLSPNKRR